jgi:hypothetical protein
VLEACSNLLPWWILKGKGMLGGLEGQQQPGQSVCRADDAACCLLNAWAKEKNNHVPHPLIQWNPEKLI